MKYRVKAVNPLDIECDYDLIEDFVDIQGAIEEMNYTLEDGITDQDNIKELKYWANEGDNNIKLDEIEKMWCTESAINLLFTINAERPIDDKELKNFAYYLIDTMWDIIDDSTMTTEASGESVSPAWDASSMYGYYEKSEHWEDDDCEVNFSVGRIDPRIIKLEQI